MFTLAGAREHFKMQKVFTVLTACILEFPNVIHAPQYTIGEHFFSFQINGAIEMNQTKKQWVDLGVLQEPCMTRPETCGAAGAAVSVWVKRTSWNIDNQPIISSLAANTSGFQIYFRDNRLR